MSDERLGTMSYRVLRYVPNLVRDEWMNIGVLLLDPGRRRFDIRLIEDETEFARLRRLHPNADLDLVRALEADVQAQMAAHGGDPVAYVTKLDETLSNVLQLSPPRGLLAEDFDAELDRLYREQVAPPRPRARAAELENTRAGIRARASDVFRRAQILARLERSVRIAEFTYPGDPLRLDFAYRRNGTRGFVHALALGRDPSQAKALAFTAERVRTRLASVEFAAVTEQEPSPQNERHKFISSVLADQQIAVIHLARLEEWANRLRPTILQ
jgi:hypothetical protein